MLIWKNGAVTVDNWQLVLDEEGLTADYPVVSLARWLAQASGDPRVRQAGILIRADDDIDVPALTPARHALVAVAFEAASDGRAFSTARLLRRRGYAGDLRAVGPFERDQLAFLERCGFTSYALGHAADGAGFATSREPMTLVYQTAADRRTTIAETRRAAGRA